MEQFLDPKNTDKGFICFVCCEIKSNPEYNVDHYISNNQILLCEECNLDFNGCDNCECTFDPYDSITLIPPIDNATYPVTEIKYWNKLCANCGNKTHEEIIDFLRYYIISDDSDTIYKILKNSINNKNIKISEWYNKTMKHIDKIKETVVED